MNRLQHAFNLFDEYNQKDPRWIIWKNEVYPQEYAYALMLNEWILSLQPASGEELLLASRCQHIGRWEIPRNSYPDGREAYLKWRKDLALHHAHIAGSLMQQAGYDRRKIDRVGEIILKKRIKQDDEVQIMENALCLIFLEHQYEELRQKYLDEPEKMINILYRSLLKMNKHGHAVAKLITYSNAGLDLVMKALERVGHN
ncbi:DUF4202 domain-containing protein [Mucilaginibacter sp. SMC90]|uniref:DUF4202 domain-containing protein n=1 Tax=Mucilaginibacter sp. SMC90 TaxID=2929803 RepID=UPI001FB467F9|nr:DUF4202 domain-containing protein [Mucilaginibacter sp. SMC90]UOE52530.1 DUF4202 domain-containing protein [Mucilaginibacter sp. SMC90]